MVRNIEYLTDKKIVQFTAQNDYKLSGEPETLKEIFAKLKENNCIKCLVDLRKVKVIGGTLDYYNRPGTYEKLWGSHILIAAVVLHEITKDAEFYETVCLNRGWNIKIFTDYDAAMEWLTA